MVGWYHSGPKLRSSDLAINELVKRYAHNSVLVVVDVRPADLGLPTNAYYAVDEIKDVQRRWVYFRDRLPAVPLTLRRPRRVFAPLDRTPGRHPGDQDL